MRRSLSKHGYVAGVAILTWVAAIVVTSLNPDIRSRMLAPVLICSVAALLGAVGLSRYWIRLGSVPPFGSLVGVPFACASLLVFGTFLWAACRYGQWYLFTPSYWEEAKGGFRALLFPFGVFWAVSTFPAAAVILYFQRQRGADDPTDAPEN